LEYLRVQKSIQFEIERVRNGELKAIQERKDAELRTKNLATNKRIFAANKKIFADNKGNKVANERPKVANRLR
jgi:hypothetical protein